MELAVNLAVLSLSVQGPCDGAVGLKERLGELNSFIKAGNRQGGKARGAAKPKAQLSRPALATWLARGESLGVAIPQEQVPLAQKKHHPDLYPPCQACNCGHAHDGIHDREPGSYPSRDQRRCQCHSRRGRCGYA